MDGRKGKLARERNGVIWREGGGGADRFGSERERDRDLNVSLLDTQKPDCAADEKGREEESYRAKDECCKCIILTWHLAHFS